MRPLQLRSRIQIGQPRTNLAACDSPRLVDGPPSYVFPPKSVDPWRVDSADATITLGESEIERGRWGVIDAASNLCQVTGGNVVELGDLMTAGLTSYNTAVANMATVIDIHKALAHTPDDPPPTPNISEGTAG